MLEDLITIKKIFKESKAKMFLLYGTALGAYRDHNFLPGDDDLDLGSFDIRLRNRIAKKMREAGFTVSICWDEWVGYRESEMIHADRNCHIDIFFFRKTQEGYVASRSVKEEPFVLLPPNTKKKFKSVTLLAETFNVLSPVEEYLEFCYESWWDSTKKDHGKLYHDIKGKPFIKTIYTK